MFASVSRRSNYFGDIVAALAALAGSGIGCFVVICVIMIGPWCLQYDLNTWIPYLNKSGMGINNVAPVQMSFLLFVVGIFLSEIAIPVAVLTWLLFGLGILS